MSQVSPIDRRITRTKAAIRCALAVCVNESGFDTLSVKDITTRAGVNRGTFYLHYHDKVDLIEKVQAEVIQDFERIILESDPTSFADLARLEEPLPVIISLFTYLKENADLMNALLKLKGDVAFHTHIKRALETNLRKIGFLAGAEPEQFQVPGDYLISYVLSAYLGVLQQWLQSGCIESPEEMAGILSKLSVEGPVRVMAGGKGTY